MKRFLAFMWDDDCPITELSDISAHDTAEEAIAVMTAERPTKRKWCNACKWGEVFDMQSGEVIWTPGDLKPKPKAKRPAAEEEDDGEALRRFSKRKADKRRKLYLDQLRDEVERQSSKCDDWPDDW